MRLRHIALLVALFAGLLTGCGREQSRLSVTAHDFGFSGVGQSISGGTVEITFKNSGKANHELGFIDIGDTPFSTFATAFDKFFESEGAPFPKFLKRLSGAGELEPGESKTTTITLPKGKYLMMCALDDAPGPGEKTVKPHYNLGMHQNVSVDGPDKVELDAPGGVFHAQDYTFVPPSDLKAGKNTFAFVNSGPKQWHFLYIQEWPKGTTAAKAEASFGNLLKLGEDAPPPAGFKPPKDLIDTFVFSPGMGQTFEATFKSGYTYLAACFINDLAGGPPHAIAHHMYKAWTVK
jgi:uncharacterized cupredoxin-like copper-binding protein